MKRKLQFAGWLMALGMSAPLAVPCFAQGPRANGAQNRQENRPPKQQNQPPRQQQQRQEQRREHRQQQETRRAQNARPNSGANRPPNPNMNRAETAMRPNNNPNRPPSAYTPPPKKEFNSLSPQERQKVLENNRRLQNLPPAQRQELQDRVQVWNKLTPEQRQHIRSDILPKWQQMPPDRKRAIQQRLGVLKNMPESARNQHLNDPNFTRGMSQEDQATLRDLSHLHVGGSPDPPNE
ncbi:MAG TPA: DUF3106 domain-containing protein [Candidatus Dormibacteraeota bacterium]|nr:DUF3106 domain-containing protein [Candidatus Dormibacteraeota bacterium]